MKNQVSKKVLFGCFFLFFCVWYFFYPKWEKQGTEATISWDVSGYYLYLPATFIYHDIKHLDFVPEILKKYYPTPDFQQAFKYENGNYVMKYSMGQALVYLPFFTLGHISAMVLGYPADGFSKPYQFCIGLGAFVIALIGLWFLRKVLLEYFSDITTTITLILILFGTNYLNYAAIDGAMTHNTLFTIYCLLIFTTISFYKAPDYIKAIGIGMLVGLAALVRPTDLLSALIPVLWNFKMPLKKGIEEKIAFFKEDFLKFGLAIFSCLFVGSLQSIYWKYVSGSWIVYSYQSQGFSWLKPHLLDGLLSYKAGWLTYTPLMFLAILGFVPLYNTQKKIFLACISFAMLFIYVTFAWDIWWYGGSLGQRAMVQSYPVFAFPLACFINLLLIKRQIFLKYLSFSILAIFIYCNIWWIYQGHGGVLCTEHMTRAYYWKVLGRFNFSPEVFKLLDTDEEFLGVRKDLKVLYFNDFESDSVPDCGMPTIEGNKSLCVNASTQFSKKYSVNINTKEAEWVRVEGLFRCQEKEWDIWKMTQFIVCFYNEDKEVKSRMIRIYRVLNSNETRKLFIDVKFPKEPVTKVGVYFWNASSNVPLLIDDLKIETFNED